MKRQNIDVTPLLKKLLSECSEKKYKCITRDGTEIEETPRILFFEQVEKSEIEKPYIIKIDFSESSEMDRLVLEIIKNIGIEYLIILNDYSFKYLN